MRIDYWQYLLDKQGKPLSNAEVRVYLAGTVQEADIYLDANFGSVTKSSIADLKTDQYGFVRFWIGDIWEVEGGYNVNQKFKIIWQNNIDIIEEYIDDIFIFTPVEIIDVSDSIKGNTNNRDKNKVISNSDGYKWNEHTDSIVPSASPHGISPVTWFDTGTLQSKVISNKLGYQMYELAITSTSTPIDISAAGLYTETINIWDTSASGIYFKEVSHGLNNLYPIVRLIKDDDDSQYMYMKVKSIDYNNIKVWVNQYITTRILVMG